MACQSISLPGGGTAIVCTRERPARCACGHLHTRLCDWKVPDRKSGTCDAPLCAVCSTSPAPDKDLCPDHAEAWRKWLANTPKESSHR